MPEKFDPGEYEISELGPAIRDIEDANELRAILETEEDGQNRPQAVALIESRIEKYEGPADEAPSDLDEIDLAELSAADVGNAVQGIDDADALDRLLEREEAGENRDSAKRLIRRRIDSVRGDEDEAAGEAGDEEPEEALPPEEKHPELDHPTVDKRHVSALTGGTYRDMWVYCETQAGDLLDVSREMLGKARELMDGYRDDYGSSAEGSEAPERVVAVLVGSDVARHAEECIACGADVVVYAEDERLERFRHKPYAEAFCQMAREQDDWRAADGREPYDEPRYVLFPATNNGRDLSAQVQAELDSGLASDCSGLYIEDVVISNPVKTGEAGAKKTFERVLHMKRPDFSGFEYSTILCLDNPNRDFHPQGASVIPGSFDLPEPDPEREGEVVEHEVELRDDWFRVEVVDHDRLAAGVDLSGREVVVAVGRGIGENPTLGMELALELADAFEDADVGVSRGIVTGSYEFDAHVEEYTREERQIGETGQVVAPAVYIAAGISGAVQHKVGMDESETIVAVNTDPEARIRDFSDYFVRGDLFEVLPRLTQAVKAGELDLGVAADGGDSGE